MDNRQYVWDLSIRVFHWSLVLLFAFSYITGEVMDHEDMSLHSYSGYAITLLLTYRILWGFVGPQYARFSNFIYPPATIIRYLKSLRSSEPEHYMGHNPAGGLMVIVLLISLFTTCFSGLLAYAAEGKGPLAQVDIQLISSAYAHSDEKHESESRAVAGGGVALANGEEYEEEGEDEEEEFWEEIHEVFTTFTLLLVFIHIAGVVVSNRLHKENLVKAMLTGYKE